MCEHRLAAERHGLRYPSDLTNAEWALVEPMNLLARRADRGRECAYFLCAVHRG